MPATAAPRTFTFVVWDPTQAKAVTRQALGVNVVAAEELVLRLVGAGAEVLAVQEN